MVKSVDSISRAMLVLSELKNRGTLSLSELQKATDINKATLLRILQTQVESGWVIKSLGDLRYRLSSQVSEVHESSIADTRIIEAAGPILKSLHDEFHWPSDIAVKDGTAMRLIESTRPLTVFTLNRELIGFKAAMLFSGVGRCYLAFCDPKERADILEKLRKTNSKESRSARDNAWVSALIKKTREQGFGERFQGYFGDNSLPIEAIAVPIFVDTKVIACLTMAWPTGAVNNDRIQNKILPKLNHCAANIAKNYTR